MTLPNVPTLYDHMVLGLRGQDTIATFNWDPFLLLTYQRHVGRFGKSRLPNLRFLHGSVIYATCEHHDVLGHIGDRCPECANALTAIEPVYPDEQKDYVSNPLLRREWDGVLRQLKTAFHLTIFGYSGPVTDGKARRLLEQAWSPAERSTDHVEVVDLIGQPALQKRWREFIPFSHLLAHSDWRKSSIAGWPRRTFEWKRAASLFGMPADRIGPCRAASLEELGDWYAGIADHEQQRAHTGRDAALDG